MHQANYYFSSEILSNLLNHWGKEEEKYIIMLMSPLAHFKVLRER
jgi:hypothetical protein